jgi:rfaE bifunctional protein nucleotidyltransferase chain/domain
MKKVGFVNGCFDIMHVGHLKLIEFCKTHCDYLIVGIDSDRMIQRAKGKDRPVNNQADRKYFLENIKGVDKVFIFNSHTVLKEKLKKIKPDVMVVGEEYENRRVFGAEHAKELKFFKKIDGYSTTKTIEDISNR